MKLADTHRVLHLKFNKKQPLGERMSGLLGRALRGAGSGLLEDLEARKWM